MRQRAEVLRRVPFSSEAKLMATTVASSEGTARVLCTGAPDVVLPRCTRALAHDGKVTALSDSKSCAHTSFQSIPLEPTGAALSASRQMSAEGLRVLALSYRDEAPSSSDPAELQRLTLVCLLGIKDKLRGDVPQAIRKCQTAGVTVRMLTGDSRFTAESIAKECGIIDARAADTSVLEGSDFRALSDAQVCARLRELKVLARCSPTDKHRLVRLLREAGEVVAVTGDGTNDALQLNEVLYAYITSQRVCTPAQSCACRQTSASRWAAAPR